MYICSLLSKTCSSGIFFGKFNQIYPRTFNNLTIFNAFSYLRHVKRLGICLPRGRSRSIINIHDIVTSCWRIECCHRHRASGVRVKRDAGHTSLSKALVDINQAKFTVTYLTYVRLWAHQSWGEGKNYKNSNGRKKWTEHENENDNFKHHLTCCFDTRIG